jgi:hypothetical protein
VVVFQILVLVLILTCQYLVLAEDDVSSSEVVLINCITLETNDFLLHLEADPLLMDIFQLLEGYLLEILVQLLDLLLLILSKLLLNRVDAG